MVFADDSLEKEAFSATGPGIKAIVVGNWASRVKPEEQVLQRFCIQ